MCRALAVLCAAPDPERLAELKRAVVAAQWELVGGATDVDELERQIRELAPHVVVIAGLAAEALRVARAASATIRIVVVTAGSLEDLEDDARVVTASRDAVRDAIVGLPAPGGPVGA
jgi:hypothetical protein